MCAASNFGLAAAMTRSQAQHERADNCFLRAENDKIRCENIAMREALKNVICPTCGGPHSGADDYFDEHKLRMENAHLKEEASFFPLPHFAFIACTAMAMGTETDTVDPW